MQGSGIQSLISNEKHIAEVKGAEAKAMDVNAFTSVGETKTIDAVADGLSGTITYTSSNPNVASVDGTGKVTWLSDNGPRIVRITATDGTTTKTYDYYLMAPQVVNTDMNTFVLKADGTVWAWGANNSGQLGQGVTSTTPVMIPMQVKGGDERRRIFTKHSADNSTDKSHISIR